MVHLRVIWKGQHQSSGNELFQHVKGFLFWWSPFPVYSLLCEVKEGSGVVREVLDEAPVEVCEPEEGLDFMFSSGSWPLCNSSHLYWVHPYFSFRDHESEVLNLCSFKLTLLQLEVELVLLKLFHHLLDYPPVLCQGLGEDQDVIQVHADHSFHDGVTEDVIHHCLEGGWTVSESKEHYQWFEEPPHQQKHLGLV